VARPAAALLLADWLCDPWIERAASVPWLVMRLRRPGWAI
jgi:hypothetical protein